MSRFRWLLLAGALASAGCSGTASRLTEPETDPDGSRRVEEILRISQQDPARWSPAVTIPLHPVLLVADTSIKFVDATGRWVASQVEWIMALFAGTPSAPRPDAVDRSAESLQHK
jgi:hypothetical protein